MGETACEIGCGAGLVAVELAKSCETIATDVSFRALKLASARSKKAGVDAKLHLICCDRVEAIRPARVFNLIVFNPPYLPDNGKDPRWSGGPSGIEKAIEFVESGFLRLKEGGFMLFILSSLSAWRKMLAWLLKAGLSSSLLRKEKVGLYEELIVVLAARRRG